MLRIRDEQIKVFRAALRTAFSAKLASFLHREFSSARQFPNETLLDIASDLALAAEFYGFRTEQAVAIYSIAQWRSQLTLETEFPEVRSILKDPSLSVVDKQAWLENWINARSE